MSPASQTDSGEAVAVREIRQALARQRTPNAPDEELLCDVVVQGVGVLRAVQTAEARLAAALGPEVLADGRRAKMILSALKSTIEVGNALARRIEIALQTSLTLRVAKATTAPR